MAEKKRRLGDRRDGELLRKIDPMHFITPIIYPNRCDNEAYISEKIDITALNRWIEEQNRGETDFPCTLFHTVVAAMLKTLMLRPKLNRFIANKSIYQRSYLSAAFVVKKLFSDDGAEALAIIYADEGDTIHSLRGKLREQISSCRSDKLDSTSDSMDILNRMPRFISRSIIQILRILDRHGLVPKGMIASDPYYSSIVLTNLGSIKLKCGYHHLTNWGTNSVFCVIGEKKLSPFYDADGNVEMRETLELGLTIDERLADGYYYSKSLRLLRRLLEEPTLLELPLGEKIDY